MRLKSKSKIKCRVCGAKFPVTRDDRYLAKYEKGALVDSITKPKVYECFDCIYCGCQNAVNERIPGADDL
jgi:Na+-translocating ferredoxin:NAD+ oxidoreductase RnfC subunit